MVSPFTTLEFRRWFAAALLTLLAVSLQVAHAARATDGAAVASDGGVAPAGPNRTAMAVLPVEVEGTVVASRDGVLGVHEVGAADPVAFPFADGALLVRDGGAAGIDDLRAGDRVQMTVDGRTGRVLHLQATPAAAGWRGFIGTAGPLAAIALAVGLGLLALRRSAPKRAREGGRRAAAPVSSTRSAPVRFGAARTTTAATGPRGRRGGDRAAA